MTNPVSHISCPACKGAVGVTNVDRFVRCAFCDVQLLVEHPHYVPQYMVSPVLDGIAARRSLQKFLTSKFLPNGLLRHARFLSGTLCYVPFYDFRTRRLGTMETTVQKKARTGMVPKPNLDTSLATVYMSRRETVPARETQLIISDIHRIEPACTLERFGLSHCSVFEYLKGKPRLQPFDHGENLRDARVYPPTLPAESIADQLQIRGFTTSVQDDTEYVESRTKVVYFPLWRLKYRFAGRLYSAVLDAVSGELLHATAPEGDQMRVMTLLLGVSIMGILLGMFLRDISLDQIEKGIWLMSHTSVGIPLVGVLALLLSMTAGCWLMVWNQFRWPGEVCKSGKEYHVEKYNSLLKKRIRLPLLTPATLLKMLFQKG
ncbi:MAG: hypothetical protein JXR76_17725 [Deltaproteobacteria bacterium]|nr:hypothetical protein [Deltaproteobacteria bacterium]